MGVGYLLGCLLSLILWKIDRQYVFSVINSKIRKILKTDFLITAFYIILLVLLYFLYRLSNNKELLNFITSFLVIDISNTERKNLKKREKVHFYDSISLISRSIVCGFIAPIMYILFFDNYVALVYALIYNISLQNNILFFNFVFNIFTIVPSCFVQIVLYLIYLCRNKKISIDFKGDYLLNFYMKPLLNVDILAAYIESVNFYYCFNDNNTDYIKSYGEYTNKIDDICIKDYLSIAYSICMVCFVVFFIVIRKFN
ncbi:hypothetical protein GCM10008905_17460 [Clostridium malenominatum]|uniref:ABC-2 family transporter protein n=1 Tax=Clostridium malenominatum TaxID=1539 RepID=A0ABN1IYL5_9CLOT